MNNVTDAEVVKALECCIKGECSKCPLKAMNCSESVVMAFARDLILRKNEYIKKCDKVIEIAGKTIKAQEKEIERLRNLIVGSREIIGHLLYVIRDNKTESMKEFADKLQDRCIEQEGCIYASDIGAVLNELLGDSNVNKNT